MCTRGAIVAMVFAGAACRTRLIDVPAAPAPVPPPPMCSDPVLIRGVVVAPPVTWVGAADFDGDGRVDVAGAGAGLSIAFNEGQRSFAEPPHSEVRSDVGYLAALGEVNGDGRADAVIGRPGGPIELLRGTAVRRIDSTDVVVGFRPSVAWLALGNLDDQGASDLVVLEDRGPGNLVASTAPGEGGTFARVTFPAVIALDLPFIALADVTGSGRASLIVPRGSGAVDVFVTERGDTTIARPVRDAATLPRAARSLVLADLDGDGTLDLAAVADLKIGNNVFVAHGLGDGRFAAAQELRAGESPVALVAVDWNGDGRRDLVVANSGNDHSASFLFNLGGGTFAAAQPCLAVTFDALGGPSWIDSADFDDDGRPDLAFSWQDGISVIFNDSVR